MILLTWRTLARALLASWVPAFFFAGALTVAGLVGWAVGRWELRAAMVEGVR